MLLRSGFRRRFIYEGRGECGASLIGASLTAVLLSASLTGASLTAYHHGHFHLLLILLFFAVVLDFHYCYYNCY
jgi:hypothetical protein